MHSYGGLLVPRGSKLALLKSTFNAENFIRRVVLVYLQWSRRSSFLKCMWQPQIAKKISLKTPILGFKVVQGYRCWYPRKAPQQCLLWCAASLCLSVTVLLLDWTTEAETARFQGSTQIWCTCTYGGSLQSRGSNLTLLKSMFNAKHCIQVVRSISNGFGAIHC